MAKGSKLANVVKPVHKGHPGLVIGASFGLVVLIVVGFVLYRYLATPAYVPSPLAPDQVAQILSDITSLPASDSIGIGSASNATKSSPDTLLVDSNGKPIVLYIGAEYCPFCAAERWPMIIALSRFGTFSGLLTDTSSVTDAYPDTATWTFRKATYTSDYIDFQSVETRDRNRSELQNLTPTQANIQDKYDVSGDIPFVDFANRYYFAGATYPPGLLANMDWIAIDKAIQNPSTPQAVAILGSANLIEAAICKITNQQPNSVCADAVIATLENQVGKG